MSLLQENGDTKEPQNAETCPGELLSHVCEDDLNLPCFVKIGEPTEEETWLQDQSTVQHECQAWEALFSCLSIGDVEQAATTLSRTFLTRCSSVSVAAGDNPGGVRETTF